MQTADRNKQAGLTLLQRYKGLGEMDAEQLWETTMNPENRVLVQVKVEDAEKADAIFTKLMGDEVDLRKSFIQTRAKFVNTGRFGYLVMDDDIKKPIEGEVLDAGTFKNFRVANC